MAVPARAMGLAGMDTHLDMLRFLVKANLINE